MKIVVYTLGCKVNQCESQSIIKQLLQLGHDVSSEIEQAEVYILNTCAVTGEAERKSRQIFSRIRKLNPTAKIIVCGCSSQNQPDKFFDDNTFVIGTADKINVVKHIQDKGILVSEIPEEFEDFNGILPTRTRAFVKVQDGCNNFCSYCIIPYLRGRSRSRQIESIINEIESCKEEKEIVLTGINLSDYGANIDITLVDLVKSLYYSEKRIRLGSLEVGVVTDELLQSLKGLKHFCPQFHLSLQSGCDRTLKKMNRHYSTDEFYEKVLLIRKHFENASVTTDVIVGFPTENDEDFLQSLKFCERVTFSDMHIFPYSVRTGTVAAKLPQLDKTVIKKRVAQLTEIKEKLKNEYIKTNLNTVHEVLFEQPYQGYIVGHTKNYIKVYCKCADGLNNQIKKVKMSECLFDGVLGELIEENSI